MATVYKQFTKKQIEKRNIVKTSASDSATISQTINNFVAYFKT